MKHEWYKTSFVTEVCLNCGRSGAAQIDECPGSPPEATISRNDDLSTVCTDKLRATKRRLRINRYRIEADIDAITDEELRRSIEAARLRAEYEEQCG